MKGEQVRIYKQSIIASIRVQQVAAVQGQHRPQAARELLTICQDFHCGQVPGSIPTTTTTSRPVGMTTTHLKTRVKPNSETSCVSSICHIMDSVQHNIGITNGPTGSSGVTSSKAAPGQRHRKGRIFIYYRSLISVYSYAGQSAGVKFCENSAQQGIE